MNWIGEKVKELICMHAVQGELMGACGKTFCEASDCDEDGS